MCVGVGSGPAPGRFPIQPHLSLLPSCYLVYPTGLFNTPTALPQFLPDSPASAFPVPVSTPNIPIPPLGYYGVTLQVGDVPYDARPQGPVIFVDDVDQHGTSYPQSPARLVALGGAGPVWDAPVPSQGANGSRGQPNCPEPCY